MSEQPKSKDGVLNKMKVILLRSYCFDILLRVLVWICRNNFPNPASIRPLVEAVHFVAAPRRSRGML